jgi:hypothetical protein
MEVPEGGLASEPRRLHGAAPTTPSRDREHPPLPSA